MAKIKRIIQHVKPCTCGLDIEKRNKSSNPFPLLNLIIPKKRERQEKKPKTMPEIEQVGDAFFAFFFVMATKMFSPLFFGWSL